MKSKWIAVLVAVVFLGAIGFYAYERWGGKSGGDRDSLLDLMPSDATAIIYIDANDLRAAPFFSALYAWAPKPQVDADYTQFVSATGFDYERDLDRLAISVRKRGPESVLFAVADGRFDRKKIAAYAAKSGTVTRQNGRDIFSVPLADRTRRVSFAFLNEARLAITEDASAAELMNLPVKNANSKEWRVRFERLAGSPVFAVVRQDAETGAALAAQAPGGLRSPQLSTLLDSLQWITIAAKPQQDGLRVVAEGECVSENNVKQLTEMLNGIVQLAQVGLNDPKTRQQVPPTTREAYLELLHSTDVSKVDRGTSQSVRVMFDLTPKFLEAARTPAAVPLPDAQQTKPAAPKALPSRK
jgi:hypothetical protein